MKKLFFIFLLLALPIYSFGQVDLPEGIKEQLTVDFSNNSPDPYESVTVKLASYASNLDKALITWSVNGAVVEKRIGSTKFTFQVGDVGSVTSLDILIEKQQGGNISKQYFFNISEVDLMYTAQTSVPKIYDGKAMFSNQSAVKIFAEPRFLDKNGALIPKDQLIYYWEINDFNRQDLSGYGKDFIEYKGSLITRPLVVAVTVNDPDSDSSAKKEIVLDPVDQEILVYEKNPLLGIIYDRAIDNNFLLDRGEVELKAENLFFNLGEQLATTWNINGKVLDLFKNLDNVVFKNENNEVGLARISISSENPERILQGANTTLKLEFKNAEQ